MKGKISKRCISLLLAVLMVLSALPIVTLQVFAATNETGLFDSEIGIHLQSQNGICWANGTTAFASAFSTKNKDIFGNYSYSPKTASIQIQNHTNATAKLFFDYAVEGSGIAKIGKDNLSGTGTYSVEIKNNRSANITVTSEKNDNGVNKGIRITVSNIALVNEKAVRTTFKPAENGSYTVSGEKITANIVKSLDSYNEYKLKATPDAGYKFVGWYNETTGKYISTTAEATLHIDEESCIIPQFVSAETAVFETGMKMFADFNDAVKFAQANKLSKITLVSDGTISGNYTVPSGITLLIPFDEAKTCYTDTPTATSFQANAEPFRTLTMAKGSSVTLESGAAISVGGQYYAAPGGSKGKIVGPYGFIKMESGSAITVKSGASLYAWGFISGSGAVTVESGGSVYEWYQVLDFRGGTATFQMDKDNKVFPFNQYAVQNVEVPLTIHAGASETVYTAVYAKISVESKIHPTSIPFIADDGMFRLVSGSLTKAYDGSTDRVIYTVDGTAEVNSLNLKLAGMSVSSSSYVLPLTNNMTISLTSGSKLTVNQTAALLPGVQASIAKGAELRVSEGKSIYIYDADEWGGYCGSGDAQYIPVVYAPGRPAGARAPLADAKVDVNGKLTAIGGVYTTASGADICSSDGTGQYVQQGAPGTETKTYQYTQKSGVTAHEIPITPAKLHNTNDTYTETKGSDPGDTYLVYDGIWALKKNNITITFNANGGTGEMAALMANPGYDKKLSSNTFTREGYTFTGWNTKADGTGTGYADGAIVNFSANTTLYAQWTQNPVITFDANDGKGIMGTQTVNPGVSAALPANTFTRADYDFAGWNTKADGTGTAYADKANITTNKNVTLYAQWKLHTYHVRWLNWDDSVLQEGEYTCEEYAYYDDFEHPIPPKPEDENYTYKFANRWTPYDETKGIDGWGFKPHEDVDFKAVFKEFKKLTVTFNANGGDGTMDTVKIANGSSDEPYMLPKCDFTREGYVFDGWLITGTVGNSVWASYELNDEKWEEESLLAFSDLSLKASWKHADGWFTDDNGKQYYNNGKLQKTGWTKIDGQTYYLDPETGYAATGIATLVPDGATEEARCVFDAKGVFQSNVTGVYSVGNDTYWLNSGIIEEEAGLKRVVKKNGEVNYYYFAVQKNLDEREGLTLSAAVKSTVLNGKDCWLHKTNGLALPEWGYYFDENGVILHDEDTSKNGILKDGEDLYYYVDGIKAPAGMIKIGDDYYYANSKGKLIVNQTYYCSRMNGLMEEGTYAFDAAGKLIPGATDKNGIVRDDDGVLRYYVNGKVTYVGLIKIDGDFYYVRSSGEVVAGCVYYITWTHGLKDPGYYTFDKNGKLIGAPKNGIVKDEDGVLRYYVNGKLTYAGLIEINGDYYYVNSKCEVVHDCDYYITWTHDLKPQGRYHFDADGKMTEKVAPLKNGIYAEDGSLYYYRNGERTYAGLIEINGDYYYVNSKCEVVHDCDYYITWTHDLKPQGRYHFDADGKMTGAVAPLKNGIYEEDGSLYYYRNGERTYAGLIEIDGDYYYVRSNCEVVHGCRYYVYWTHGLVQEGYYNFDSTGRMILDSKDK